MTPENLASFVQSCTGTSLFFIYGTPKTKIASVNVEVSDDRVVRAFKSYDKAQKGYLALEEFMQFFADSAVRREDIVRNNLKALGYGNDLCKFWINKDWIATCVFKSQKLPRHILSNNDKFLGFLFTLLGKYFFPLQC